MDSVSSSSSSSHGTRDGEWGVIKCAVGTRDYGNGMRAVPRRDYGNEMRARCGGSTMKMKREGGREGRKRKHSEK